VNREVLSSVSSLLTLIYTFFANGAIVSFDCCYSSPLNQLSQYDQILRDNKFTLAMKNTMGAENYSFQSGYLISSSKTFHLLLDFVPAPASTPSSSPPSTFLPSSPASSECWDETYHPQPLLLPLIPHLPPLLPTEHDSLSSSPDHNVGRGIFQRDPWLLSSYQLAVDSRWERREVLPHSSPTPQSRPLFPTPCQVSMGGRTPVVKVSGGLVV
jgi:hypothetical protein